MVAFHLLAVAALFMFTWKGFFCFIGLWVFAINMGIGMGYHRLLTHRGYRTPKWLEYFLSICGTLALEGGPISGSQPTASITSSPTARAIRTPPMTAGGGRMPAGFSPATPCTMRLR